MCEFGCLKPRSVMKVKHGLACEVYEFKCSELHPWATSPRGGKCWEFIVSATRCSGLKIIVQISSKYCSHTLDTPRTYQLPGGETNSSTFTRLFVSDAHQSLDDSLDELESCGQQLAATRPVPF